MGTDLDVGWMKPSDVEIPDVENERMLQKAACPDDGVCHNNDARILSFALKLQCSTAKLARVAGVGVGEGVVCGGEGGGRWDWVYRW